MLKYSNDIQQTCPVPGFSTHSYLHNGKTKRFIKPLLTTKLKGEFVFTLLALCQNTQVTQLCLEEFLFTKQSISVVYFWSRILCVKYLVVFLQGWQDTNLTIVLHKYHFIFWSVPC